MEQHQKKVAIVVPVYNAEEFLSECLDSIFSQTYTNFDIIAVDDASTDNSLQILLNYQKKDSRLIVLKRDNNGGPSAARNTALKEIEKRKYYSYISFCDSDDKISSRMIEELVSAIVSEKADIASCCFSRFNFQKKDLGKFTKYCSYSPESFVEQIFSLGEWQNTRGNGGFVYLRLFDAQKIKGIRFCANKHLVEDEIYCLEVATKISKITHIPQNLYFYRFRANSLSNEKTFFQRLLHSRIKSLTISQEISEYALILNACAIAKYLKGNENSVEKETATQIAPLLKSAKRLNLISRKQYFKFYASILKIKFLKRCMF